MRQIPLYEQIYKDVSEAITSKKYSPGDKLPSEKELAEQYGVSRITSKKALEILSEEGKITRIAGKGSFVAKIQNEKEAEECMPGKPPESMGDGQVRLVGVLMEGFGACFGMELLNSIERECRNQGFAMILRCSDGSIEREAQSVDELRKLGVEGMIVMCSQNENYNPKILQMVVEGFPVVTVDRQMKGIPVSFVGTDNVTAAKELTKYLLDRGYRKICFAKPAAIKTSTLRERQKGFVMALNEAGILADERNWITDFRSTLPSEHSQEMVDRDLKRADRFLDDHPDIEAFLAVEYSIARILYKCLSERQVSDRYPIVCFDSVDDITNDNMFTHVKQNETAIGREAVRVLAKTINGELKKDVIQIPYQILEKTK